MRLKLYRAADMAQAMADVRAELGGEAMILSSRRVGGGVEVTAAINDEKPPTAAASASQRLPAAAMPADPQRDACFAWHGVPPPIARRLGAGALAFALSVAFRFSAINLAPGAPPLLLAGPPGAGKTLTAARLATRLVMAGRPPLVITADGKRAGACEQLAAFTRLLGLQLLVASSPAALERALAHRRDESCVVIDAPGSDPFDPGQIVDLQALASSAKATTALVLPAGLDPAEAADLAAAYRDAGADLMVATRLDTSRRLGGVLAAAATGLTMVEAGIGPSAVDGLAPMTPDLLAKRLLHVPPRLCEVSR